MTVLATFLLALATVGVPTVATQDPVDFTISVNDGEVPIHCSVNDKEVVVTQEIIDTTEKKLSLLKARLFLDIITPEQNQELFNGELFLSALVQIRAAHNLATYYCKHPEELPKVAPGPIS
jgi:hypothetical protein